MSDYVGYVVTVADVKSFCGTMNKAIRLGRLLCNIYNQHSFSITLTTTGDTATFSKDTFAQEPEASARPKRRKRNLAEK